MRKRKKSSLLKWSLFTKRLLSVSRCLMRNDWPSGGLRGYRLFEFCDWDHNLFGRLRRGREPGDTERQWVISCCHVTLILWNSARSHQDLLGGFLLPQISLEKCNLGVCEKIGKLQIPIFHKRAMDTRIPYYVMFITFYDYYESWYIAPFKKRTPDFDPIIFWWYSHHIPIRFTSCSHGPTSGDPGDPLRRSCRPSPWTPMLRAQWGGRGVEPRIEFPNHTIDEHVLEQKEVFFCPPKKHQTQIWLGSAFN